LAVAALVVSACQAGASPSPTFTLPTAIGQGEGALSVLAWPGYAEDGVAYPEADWVTPFEEATGCQTTVQVFATSDEAFQLMSTNPTKFDVISASGDASRRLVRGGFVQPINVDIISTYPDIIPALKDKPWNTVDGVHYGIPHGRGPNLMMWNTEKITTAPTGWAAMFDPNGPGGNQLSVYDAPIYIADAAVVLKATKPDLKITDPYSLDDSQFQAAVDLLKQQRPNIKEYWTDYTKQMDAFRNGNAILGTSWQYQLGLLQTEDPPVPVEAIKPSEGATGWSDTWMINSKTEHLNCSYLWLQHITSPEVNIQVAEWFGEAPANSKACALSTVEGHCDLYHAEDESYWADIYYWSTPEETCLDGRTDVKCKGFDAWITAWTEIKG
jgi:putative spermidine/putrescine transport system substrate-binding protein